MNILFYGPLALIGFVVAALVVMGMLFTMGIRIIFLILVFLFSMVLIAIFPALLIVFIFIFLPLIILLKILF